MKKLLLFMVLFSLSFVRVNADSNWSEWTDEKPTIENIEIETEIRYKWYKENKIDLGYKNKSEDVCEYLDYNDTFIQKTISMEFPEVKEDRIIKPLTEYKTKNTDYLSAVHFYNFIINENVLITEVELLSNDEILKYSIFQPFQGNFDKLSDKNYEEVAFEFQNYNKLSFELEKFYSAENFILKIYFLKNTQIFNQLSMSFGHEKDIYVAKGTMDNVEEKIVCQSNYCFLSIPVKDYVEATDYIFMNKIYEYEDTLYKCYSKEKEYLDGYYTNIEGYTKDEENKKIYYRYKEIETEEIGTSPEYRKVEITYNKLEEKTNTDIIEEIEVQEEPNTTLAIATKEQEKTVSSLTTIKIIIISCLVLLIITIICMKLKEKYQNSRLN